MVAWPNATASSQWELDLKPEELQKSTCVLGFIPVIYYSVLLCVGMPGTRGPVPQQQASPSKPAWPACC